VNDRNERLLATFLELVQIDSPSGEEASCAAYCAEQLAAAGCDVRFDDSAGKTGSNTGNLIAELPGDGPAVLILSAHLDTVEPGRGVVPRIEDGYVLSEGETILGADDKAGLAASIECVRRLAERGSDRPTVRCVFTVQEEVGLRGAKHVHADALKCDLCLVLDAEGPVGGVIVGAPTHYTFDALFEGRAAHAGVAPEQGISAIAIAADAISHMQIGRLDDETTANVGSIQGGNATNVITPKVVITGECRSLNRARVEQVREAMEKAMEDAAARAGGSADVVWTCEYEGFGIPQESGVVRAMEAACSDTGLKASLRTTGGGSDANIFAGMGVPTLALSCGMLHVHGVDERIAIHDLEALVELIVAAALRLESGAGGAL